MTVRQQSRRQRALHHVRDRIEFWGSFEPEELVDRGASEGVKLAGKQLEKALQEEANLVAKGVK